MVQYPHGAAEKTMPYTPPFQISAEAINKIALISALVERYAIGL